MASLGRSRDFLTSNQILPGINPLGAHMIIPLVDLSAQIRDIEDEIWPEIQELFRSGEFIGGKPVAAFENAYAEYLQTSYCVGVGNGTDALELALRAVGVVPGTEVIVPVNTFIATAEAVLRIGATPVFVDVDETYLLIDPQRVEGAITHRTSAIIPVHLYGQVAPVDALLPIARRAGAAIVEDAAQSQGARRFGQAAGSLGLISATSFYPGKNLGAAGDAGAVMTNDAALARSVRLLSAHGSPEKYVHETIGFNSRMDALQAVVLRAKLRRLDAWNALRQQAADRYDRMLASIEGVVRPVSAPGNADVWHLYVVRVNHRDAVLRRLQECGVGAGIHYPDPLHRTRALANVPISRGGFPVAERSADRILSLPLHPHITEKQQEQVVEILRDALRGGSR
jgi:dTDP-4-amino-4,6-dideoxygalactose transaminase